jgi:hypothetical protein
MVSWSKVYSPISKGVRVGGPKLAVQTCSFGKMALALFVRERGLVESRSGF